ncbi:hypothetical protein CMU94_17915 [Elizabethkingia anophelis]|nr:hypothetical protein [Elizabethkingia anophelis]
MNTLQFVQVPKEELMKEIESLFLKLIENFKMTDPPKEEKALYTREEVSKLLQVSYPTLHNWNRDNILKSKKIGKRVYYSKDDVLARLKV